MRRRDLGRRLRALRGRLRPHPVATTCWVCGTRYRPALTVGECPVCGRPTDGPAARTVPRPLDADTRVLLLVGGAMAANLLILAVLAGLYLTQG